MTLVEKIKRNREIWEGKTPCFILDRTIVRDKLKEFRYNFEGEIAYSLKTNPHPEIVRIVNNIGNTFTVCSLEELSQLHEIIGDSSRVIYLSPSLDEEELKEALQFGVKRVSLDSPAQVELVDKYKNRLDEVFVRVSTASMIKKEDFPYEKHSFLGMTLEDVVTELERFEPPPLKIGLHNHLSSQNTDIESWRQNLQVIYGLTRDLKEKGINLNSLNLGGGFPVSYTKTAPSLNKIRQIVRRYQQEMRSLYPDLEFIFEPGRYIVAESVALVTRVMQQKRFSDKNILVVDSSAYNSYMDAMLVGLELPCKTINPEKTDNTNTEKYTIRGRSPCSLDILRREVNLPKTEVGDYIIFLNAGAYNFASDFVSLEKPKTITCN